MSNEPGFESGIYFLRLSARETLNAASGGFNNSSGSVYTAMKSLLSRRYVRKRGKRASAGRVREGGEMQGGREGGGNGKGEVEESGNGRNIGAVAERRG